MSSSVNAGSPDAAGQRQAATVQWLVPVAMGLLLVFLAWRLVQYVGLVVALIPLPYSIDYGEGVVMQQAMLIPGPLMYGDINQYPYLVFEYPPLYHCGAGDRVARLRPAAGRALDFGSLHRRDGGLIATLVAHAVRINAGGKIAAIAAGAAALTIFTYIPVDRLVDHHAGRHARGRAEPGRHYLAMLGTRRRWLLYVAAVVFVLAIYTKQTMVSAPIATLAVLWLRTPRSVPGPLALALVLAGSALAWLEWQTGNLAHIIVYVNSPVQLRGAVRVALAHARRAGLYFAVVAHRARDGVAGAAHARANGALFEQRAGEIRHDDAALLFVIFSVYFVLSTGDAVDARPQRRQPELPDRMDVRVERHHRLHHRHPVATRRRRAPADRS